MENELTNLSLFTGIGGLDLAAEMAGFKTVGQCEFAEFPTKVLEKHWPDVERWKDVRGLSANEFYQRTGRKSVTVLSGGFPCQPHSVAGKRKASSDERDLWPEFRRVIGEIRPKWVVAENVRGLLTSESGRFFRGILRDFADLGYDAGWCCYRAADVGAIHSRQRIAIIAYSRSSRQFSSGGNREERRIQSNQKWNNEKNQSERGKLEFRLDSNAGVDVNFNSKLFKGGTEKEIQRERRLSAWESSRNIEEWQRRCNEFEPKLLRNFHGIPGGMDRVKALGNAVVPQQFYPVYKLIADMEDKK